MYASFDRGEKMMEKRKNRRKKEKEEEENEGEDEGERGVMKQKKGIHELIS